MSKPLYKPKDEQALMTELWDPAIAENPYNFVMFAFPWGKAGTPLAKHQGPRTWQRDALMAKAEHIANNRNLMANGKAPKVMQNSTASGRGIGKSSLLAMEVLWMMTCNLGSTTIVTANTESQLVTRTWPELGKWHTMAINSHWFIRNSAKLFPSPWFEESLKRDLKVDTGYYYAQAQTWSEENPDAFAGAHNDAGIMLKFDEASGIPKPIWTVAEGFFTEPVLHRYWDVYSNPRRNTGAFFETHHRDRNFWNTRSIDARTVEGTDRAVYDKIIAQHGEDSDEARVEVRGMFPSQGDKQFIGRNLVEAAQTREVFEDPGAPLIFGVDVARGGNAQTVLYVRNGRDGRSVPPMKRKGMDNVQVANFVAEQIDKMNPDAVFIDSGGVGGGVYDILKNQKYRVTGVDFGSGADEPMRFMNKRAEMWSHMKDWLAIGAIPDDKQLADDLTGPERDYHPTTHKLLLESKEHMSEVRGLASPDVGDALALTFARRVARNDSGRRAPRTRVASGMDYPVLG
jgi:hypothetical protein